MARVGGHLRAVGAGRFSGAYEGTGDQGYDEDGFYVRSTNEHDHTRETRVAMPPNVKAQIDDLLASGVLAGTPIKSYQSFMRDASVHNLHRLARITGSPELAALARQQRELAVIDQHAEESKRLRSIIVNAGQYLGAAIREGDTFLVRQHVAAYEEVLLSMREPYGSELDEELKDARRWLRARERT